MSMVPTSPAQTRVHIRWMIRRDMPEVLAIEHASFEYPWCEEEFLRVLRQRNCIGMVAEHGERIVGLHDLRAAPQQDPRARFRHSCRIPPPGRRSADDRQAGREALEPAAQSDRAFMSVKRISRRNCSIGSWVSAPWKWFGSIIADTGEDAYSMQYHLDESLIEDERPTNRIAKQFGG